MHGKMFWWQRRRVMDGGVNFKGVHRNVEKVIRGQNSAARSDIIIDELMFLAKSTQT